MAERLIELIARLTLRYRWFSLTGLLAITVFFAYQATSVQMYSQFADLLPQAHPYVKAYNHFRDTFGSANLVILSLEVKNGDIFTTKELDKLRRLTEEVDLIDGVDHYQVASLAHVTVRKVIAAPGGMIISAPVLPADIPTDPLVLNHLRQDILHNDAVYGTLVAPGGKAALVVAAFDEERVDYAAMYKQIMQMRREVEDDNTRLAVTGEPMLKAWVWHYKDELVGIFSVTGLFVVVTLVLYFRRFYGVLLPLVGAATQIIWGLGFVGLLGYNLDLLVLVVPMLVTARAASHGVQMVERYFEELELSGDRRHAAYVSMRELLLPGSIGVLADAAGILVLGVATIPLVRKVAFFASFWGLSNIFTVLLLVPLLLYILPKPQLTEHYVPHWLVAALHRVGEICTGPFGRWAVCTVAAVVVILGIREAMYVPVGDTEAGSSLLWPNSDYNQSTSRINSMFGGSQQLVVYLKGDKPNAMKQPEVLKVLESFCRYMLEQPEAGATRDLPTLIRGMNRIFHYNDPKWSALPENEEGIGQMLFMFEAGAPTPGVILKYTDFRGRDGQLVIFYNDLKGTTVREAIERAKLFIAAHPMAHIKFVLAGGTVGITAALNEEIAYSDRTSTILIVAVVFTLVAISYQSLVAGAMVMLTLIAAGVVSFLYIGLKGIGININTLPVTAVGMGIGVDYILYVVDRIKREYGRLHDYDLAIKRAISTSGMAVTFTATTLVGGVLPWYWISSLRFSAEMALLLALLMVTHWLAAVTLVPAIFAIVKPDFVTRAELESAEIGEVEPAASQSYMTGS